MAEYQTEQKRMLSDFLCQNADSAYSVEELVSRMSELYGSSAPGKSTVYRLITRLTEEGTVKRFVKGHSRRFVYQIVMGDHCHSHLHMRCMDCGKLLHLDDSLSHELLGQVLRSSNFAVNEEETVLLGECADCNRQRSREKQAHQHKGEHS